MKFIFLPLLALGAMQPPSYLTPVSNFAIERYLGKWYEIARLDHSFERGLENVTAEYSRRTDGGIKVLNRGYSQKNKKWQQSEGRAYFVADSSTGFLKVSFFGPFFGKYVIFELDSDYRYAFIGGDNRDYLWLLSRSPTISADLRQKFIQRAEQLGYNSANLIFVNHQEKQP